MPVGLGRRRFLVEAGFLIVVAVIAGVARLSAITIVLLMAVAGLLVAAVECARSRVRRAHAVQAALPAGVARRARPKADLPADGVVLRLASIGAAD